MRITFVIYSIGPGGAERVMSRMANYWSAKGWPVTILTLKDGSEPPFYELDEGIRYCPLGLAGNSRNYLKAIYNNLRRIYRLRQAIKESRPQVVISFMGQTNVLTLLCTWGLSLPVVISEQVDPYHSNYGWLWNCLRHLLYPRAARVILLAERSLSYFSPRVRRVCKVIPNPIVNPLAEKSLDGNGPNRADQARIILGMGRLDQQKGFDILLEAFSKVAPAWPDWSLEIWGEGPERPELERLIGQMELGNRVRLPGLTQQPYEKMQRAGLFVMSSRYEGFPNVLGEAMAGRLPVISFDCPTGPRELIRDGLDGLLVPPNDVSALARAIDRLLADEGERNRLAQTAPAVLERFGFEKTMDSWEETLHEVTQSVNEQ